MKAVFSGGSISQGHADLHTHTHYSGFNKAFFIPYPESVTPPERMVNVAVKKGLDVLCITDHDEIDGALRAQRYSRKEGLETEVVVSSEGDGMVFRTYRRKRCTHIKDAGRCVHRIPR
jgi:DNA polymerase III alpha subunit